jgi:hypothetical protein
MRIKVSIIMLAMFSSSFLLSNSSLAGESQETCPATSAYRFIDDQEYGQLEFGYFANFDFTKNESCMKASLSCRKHKLHDNGYAGFFERHTIYYITYGKRVVFAKTSNYFESTYGQTLGVTNAQLLRDEKFKELSLETGCSSTLN